MRQKTVSGYLHGTVQSFDDRAGYGYICPESAEGLDSSSCGEDTLLLVHRYSLRDPRTLLEPGERVLFSTSLVSTGTLAMDVHSADPTGDEAVRDDEAAPETNNDPMFTPTSSINKGTEDWLARALIARNNRRYAEAIDSFEKGLLESPDLTLIMSYAAMLKNIGRREDAIRAYERGIGISPNSAKLHEDAGVLAASLRDFRKAIGFLDQALYLCRSTKQGGEKGVLLALARTYYDIGSAPALERAFGYYREAQALFQRGNTQLPKGDILRMNLAGIQTEHHRGRVTVAFLRTLGFEIIRASFLRVEKEGAELIVEINRQEFKESYGIERPILIRCMFKNQATLDDLRDFDKSIQELSKSGLVDDEVAFVIVASVPEALERLLWKRIEEKAWQSPAIIPLSQSEIEGGDGQTLRSILSRWLYRRDLFAGNRPVVGRRFFGRDRPLAELRDAIDNTTCAGVYGLRKVGKTSLLKESARRLLANGDLVVYIDLLRVPEDVTDCRWLYWKIAHELHQVVTGHYGHTLASQDFKWRLGGQFDDFLAIEPGFPVATAFDSDLMRLLKALDRVKLSPRPRVALLLDEIERLLPTALGKPGMSGYFEFFGYLRGVNQETDNFVVIATGANAALTEAAQFGGRDNPVFNFFKGIYLPLLARVECDTMIRQLGRGMGITFLQTALQRIYELTGGHPFFTRQLCSFIAQRHEQRPLVVDIGKVEKITDLYISNKGSDFQEIIERLKRDFPEELTVCLRLAKAGGSLPLDAMRDQGTESSFSTSIRHLIGYQLVTVKDNWARLTVELLSHWLRKSGGG